MIIDLHILERSRSRRDPAPTGRTRGYSPRALAWLLVLLLVPVSGAGLQEPRDTVLLEGVTKPTWVSLDAVSLTICGAEPRIERYSTGCRVIIDVPGFMARPREQDAMAFTAISVPGWSTRQEVGLPAVPWKNIMMEIPPGVEPIVRTVAANEVLVGPIDVPPAQPAPPDVMPEPQAPPLQKDPVIYGSDRPYPQDNIIQTSVGTMRNRRILSIEVTPVRVRPLCHDMLFARHLEIEVSFGRPPGDAAGALALSSTEYLPEGDNDGRPSLYMILTDDQWATNAALSELVDWKRRKGYAVVVVRTSDINTNAAPRHDEIRHYLRALPGEDYPEYLLIVGDHDATNGVEGFYFSTYGGGWSDLYLSCRDEADFLPDLYCGRLPATSDAHLTTMLRKVLATDRTPTTEDYYQRVCVAAQIQGSVSGAERADRLFCETADVIATFFEEDADGPDYACERAIVNPGAVTTNCLWHPESVVWNPTDRIGYRVWQHFVSSLEARTRVAACVNRGVSLLYHRDHGFADGSGWAHPYFVASHVNALTNGTRLCAVFSVDCSSGAYHQRDGFTRAWLQNTKGGAYAVFAPVDVSYSWHNDWLAHGFCAAFLADYVSRQNSSTNPAWSKDLPAPGGAYGAAGSAKRLGQVLNFGKLYYRENYSTDETAFRLYHLFGDPESFLLLRRPETISVSHAASIAAQPTTLAVVTGEGDSRVCLYSKALGIHVVTNTTSEGVARFDISPPGTGAILVTVTRYNRRPYEGTIAATPVADYTADTDGDGLPDAWEEEYFGSATGGCAQADNDGDGSINLAEWTAGTDPTDPSSVFEIDALGFCRSGCQTLSWRSAPNRSYVVYRSTNLSQGFLLLAGDLQATPPRNTYTDASYAGHDKAFYSIAVRK